jgi:hypothetical protein
MGGHPKHLLEGADPNWSERPTRKKAIAAHLLEQAERESQGSALQQEAKQV